MSISNKAIPVDKVREVSVEVGKALGDVIKKHPKESLVVCLFLGSLYILKDQKVKFKLKKNENGAEVEFETE